MKKDRHLSILTFSLGVLLITIGVIYEFFNMPDGWKGIVAGTIIIGLSTIIFIFSRNRKEKNK